jgi:hypothetical protein
MADQKNKESIERLSIKDKKEFSIDALSRLKDQSESIKRIHGCIGTDPTLFS